MLDSDPVSRAVENAIFQWEEGHDKLRQANRDSSAQRSMNRSVSAIHAELRRRLGASFRIEELAALYNEGTDWCLAVALEMAPPGAPAPDPAATTDGAFYLYMREASDFAGGRIVTPER